MLSPLRLFTLALSAGSVFASMTGPQIVVTINTITSASQALQGPANSINVLSPALFLIGQGPFPTIIQGLANIAQDGTNALQGIQGTGELANGQQTNVFNAFRDFVTVHQELLSILIGKAGILQDIPFVGGPVASVLRTIESVVDSFALELIDVAQNEAANLQNQATALDGTLNQAINAYSGQGLVKDKLRRSYPIDVKAM